MSTPERLVVGPSPIEWRIDRFMPSVIQPAIDTGDALFSGSIRSRNLTIA
jgi:hypothetical protein